MLKWDLFWDAVRKQFGDGKPFGLPDKPFAGPEYDPTGSGLLALKLADRKKQPKLGQPPAPAKESRK